MKFYAILIGMLCGGPLVLAGAGAARADTPQLAIGRMTAAYNQRDLTNYMAVYARSFTLTDVSGKRYGYLSLQASVQASVARRFASQTHEVLKCKLLNVTMHGSTAQCKLAEHYVLHQTRHAPKYVYTRDLTLNVLWTRGMLGWQMASAQVSRDVITYQRQ